MRVIVTFSLVLTLVSGRFVKEPSDVVYRRGVQTRGGVDCEVVPEGVETLIWHFQPMDSEASAAFYVHPNFIGNSTNKKYSIRTDAATTGNYTLTIFNLSRSDSGKYTCQVGSVVKPANLTVADPPQAPLFTVTNDLVENTTVTFICQSVGGFPLPEYTWLLDGQHLPAESYADVKQNGVVVRSRLTMPMKNTYHQSRLMCKTTNILSSSNTSSVLSVQFSPRVSILQQNLVVLRNEQFNLTCKMSLNPGYTSLTWLKGNDVINGATRQTYSADSGVSADTQFKCRVENIHGIAEGVTTVSVHYAPEVRVPSGDSRVIDEYETLTIDCEVDAKPAASVKWMKGEQVMSSSARLRVEAIGRQDAGEYKCVATNTLSPTNGVQQQMSRSVLVSVTVNYAADTPQLEVKPVSSSGYYSARVKIQLECKVSDLGSPEADIKWYKSSNGDTALSHIGPDLEINMPQVTDTDNYWCSAENSVGSSASNTKSLKFMDIPELLPAEGSKEDNVSLSTQDYSIQCSYKGHPSPSIEWHKDGEPVADGQKYKISEDEVEGDRYPYRTTTSILLFSNGGSGVTIEDSGSYTCVASNRAGESSQRYEKGVNVIYQPRYEGYGKVAANLSSSVTVPCEVSSYPPVTSITFKKGSTELTDNTKYTLSAIEYEVGGVTYRQRRELSIADVQNFDYVTYSCVAVNAEGTNQFDIILSKTSRPDPPIDLEHTDLSWHSVHLTWQAGFDGGYTQTYSVHQLSGSMEKVSNGILESEHTVTGLSPMTEYTFQVFSHNMKGSSATYVQQVVTTPKLYIPLAALVFDDADNSLQVTVNTTEYCTKIQGSTDGIEYIDVSQECSMTPERVSIADLPYTSYRALTCVPTRLDVCSESQGVTSETGDSKEDKKKTITIAVVVSVFIVIIIATVVTAVCMLRRRKGNLQKSAANSSKTGHINPIMTPNGVPGEVHYSSQHGYNINSDLEMEDEIDALPYGELSTQRKSPQPTREPYENLDYVYASVQKKSSEQNKLNEAAAYRVETHTNNMNIQDPSSISDNSDPEGYNSQLASPYQGPDDLTEFLGPDVMAFRRLPSLSESGYSTPDSKQLKKVVYEVIV